MESESWGLGQTLACLPTALLSFTSAWLGLITEFANHLLCDLMRTPFILRGSFPFCCRGEGSLLSQGSIVVVRFSSPGRTPTRLPHQAPCLASYHGLALQWNYGVMAVLTHIDVFHPVIFRV